MDPTLSGGMRWEMWNTCTPKNLRQMFSIRPGDSGPHKHIKLGIVAVGFWSFTYRR